ncbi:hypothetical protein LSAT2_003679 [Lamellibrachia satsuma]|nr:hypothetical protein LSAT2_003679 [Lamellibrachia satsuma]
MNGSYDPNNPDRVDRRWKLQVAKENIIARKRWPYRWSFLVDENRQITRQVEGLAPLSQHQLDEARTAVDCFRPAKKPLPFHLPQVTVLAPPPLLPPMPRTMAHRVGWLTSSPKHNLEIYGLVVEVIRRKTSADLLRKLLYVDDLAVEVDREADRQDRLVEWKEIKADMD